MVDGGSGCSRGPATSLRFVMEDANVISTWWYRCDTMRGGGDPGLRSAGPQTWAPTISVVIPTLNRPESLRDTLQDLSKQTRPPDEIIVDQPRRRNDLLHQGPVLGRSCRYATFSKQNPTHRRRGTARCEASGDILFYWTTSASHHVY